jgi:hypothetical protein
MAPVLCATLLAMVLFPAPAGPSIAILKPMVFSSSLRYGNRRQMRGRPGDLQIESAGTGIHIQHFTDKIKSWNIFTFEV